VKDEFKGVEGPKVVEELDQFTGKKIIDNEVEVLKSRTLMSEVVKNLHLYATFFEEGEMSPRAAYTTSPITIEAVNPELLRKVDKVEFSFSEQDSTVIIGSNKYAINQVSKTPWGELKFVANKRFSQPAEGKLYFSLKNVRGAVGGFSSKLTVVGSNKSTVISL